MELAIKLIESVGFPITIAIISGWMFYHTQQQTREDYNKREERMFQQMSEFSKSLHDFNDTLTKIDNRLANLEKKTEG